MGRRVLCVVMQLGEPLVGWLAGCRLEGRLWRRGCGAAASRSLVAAGCVGADDGLCVLELLLNILDHCRRQQQQRQWADERECNATANNSSSRGDGACCRMLLPQIVPCVQLLLLLALPAAHPHKCTAPSYTQTHTAPPPGAPVMHSMQRKVPVKSSGRTSVVRVTVPTNWLSLPILALRRLRSLSLSGRP